MLEIYYCKEKSIVIVHDNDERAENDDKWRYLQWYVVVSKQEWERFQEPHAATFSRSELTGVAMKWRGSLLPKKAINIKAGLQCFQGPIGYTTISFNKMVGGTWAHWGRHCWGWE